MKKKYKGVRCCEDFGEKYAMFLAHSALVVLALTVFKNLALTLTLIINFILFYDREKLIA